MVFSFSKKFRFKIFLRRWRFLEASCSSGGIVGTALWDAFRANRGRAALEPDVGVGGYNVDPMLAKLLRPRAELAYFILRVVAGLLFAFHGMQKVLGVLAEHQPELGSQLWIGGVIELVTGVAIAFGLWTSWAAFLASGTMAVAYIQFHWKFALGAQFFPAINKGESALIYAVLFLYIACHGGGRWALRRSQT